MLARIPDQADIFLLARILEGAEHLVQQHVREADDGVQRRAQFMADHRQEPALGHFRGGGRLLGRASSSRSRGNLVILAQHEREDVALFLAAHQFKVERPKVVGHGPVVLAVAVLRQPDAQFEPARQRAVAHVGQRAEIGDAIGQMDAVEEAGSGKQFRRQLQYRARLGRGVQHLAMAGDAQHDRIDDVFEPVTAVQRHQPHRRCRETPTGAGPASAPRPAAPANARRHLRARERQEGRSQRLKSNGGNGRHAPTVLRAARRRSTRLRMAAPRQAWRQESSTRRRRQ